MTGTVLCEICGWRLNQRFLTLDVSRISDPFLWKPRYLLPQALHVEYFSCSCQGYSSEHRRDNTHEQHRRAWGKNREKWKNIERKSTEDKTGQLVQKVREHCMSKATDPKAMRSQSWAKEEPTLLTNTHISICVNYSKWIERHMLQAMSEPDNQPRSKGSMEHNQLSRRLSATMACSLLSIIAFSETHCSLMVLIHVFFHVHLSTRALFQCHLLCVVVATFCVLLLALGFSRLPLMDAWLWSCVVWCQ